MIYKTIPLSNGDGRVAIVDAEDYDRLAEYSWNWHKKGNHARRSTRIKNKVTTIYLHREVLNPPAGMVIDHINGDGLDNRKSNLRVVTKGVNAMNRGLRKDNKTGYRGVCCWKGKYIAAINMRTIGTYNTAEDAARAYDKAANKIHRVYARYNFPDEWK